VKIFAETDRLILRELVPSDKNGIFELDSDPEVHRYLGNKPISSPEQAMHTIELIRQQYLTHGIGRWAAIEKNSHNFVGWAGLKLNTETINNHIDFYDVGYRFIKKYWGKGYAAETAKAAVQYGFHYLRLKHIYGMAHMENKASIKVLKKTGLRYIETFDYNGAQTDWFEATKNS
jgi:ribosomal-protein-alanine N-acetyltransferase